MEAINENQLKHLISLGISHHVDQTQLLAYGHDETEDFVFPPELVLIPKTAEEISKVLAYCHSEETAAYNLLGS